MAKLRKGRNLTAYFDSDKSVELGRIIDEPVEGTSFEVKKFEILQNLRNAKVVRAINNMWIDKVVVR